ncbi:uncharacterized protein ACNS7B_009698 isoform 1-T2 [Menidia menidia]
MRKDTASEMDKPFRGEESSPTPPISPSSASTSPDCFSYFQRGLYHPPSPLLSSDPSSSESGSGSESPLTRILKRRLGECKLSPSKKRGPTLFVLYDKEAARLPSCIVRPSRPVETVNRVPDEEEEDGMPNLTDPSPPAASQPEVINLEEEDEDCVEIPLPVPQPVEIIDLEAEENPATLNPPPIPQPVEIIDLDDYEDDTQILSTPPPLSQPADQVEDSQLPASQGRGAGEDEFDGWIHFGFVKAVKTAVLHLLNTAINIYLEESCYGCSVDHPSLTQHQCKDVLEDDFFDCNYHMVMEKLYNPHFIGSIQTLLTARHIKQDSTRVRAVAEAYLYELTLTKQINQPIQDMYEQLVGRDEEVLRQLELVKEYWQGSI